MKKAERVRKGLALLAVSALLFSAGFAIRSYVVEAQQKFFPDAEIPFSLEGAIAFRLVETLHLSGHIPKHEAMVEFPEGIKPREVYSIASEYMYNAMARLMPSDWSFVKQVRTASRWWFCLGIPFLGMWVWGRTRSRIAGISAALFYAICLASVIRSTGQELSRENFAIPLWLAHLALWSWGLLEKRKRQRGLLMALSAVTLALAQIGWDLIQYYLLMSMCALCVAFIRDSESDRRVVGWGLLHWGALLGAGLLNPYLRSHGFCGQFFMLPGYGMLFAWVFPQRGRGWSRPVRLLATLLPLSVFFLPIGQAHSYGHFVSLLGAKLRFLNQKPADPSLLTYEQRIMWVPALHSANVRLILTLFPTLLLLTLPWVCGILFKSDGRRRWLLDPLPFFYITSLATFILFVRFHVFLVVFACAVLGEIVRWALRSRIVATALVLSGLFLAAAIEARHVVRDAVSWGRANVYYREVDALTEWLAEEVAPEPVLANFGISGSILTYGYCPIVLHPKFETDRIRTRVEQYGELLFKGDEEALRSWMSDLKVRYLVFARGEFASRRPDLQMRYFVDALKPGPHAPARRFEETPRDIRYFRMLWENRKYRVFRMVTLTEEREGAERARAAREALQTGDMDTALEEATRALTSDPGNGEALQVYKHASTLKESGFGENRKEEQ